MAKTLEATGQWVGRLKVPQIHDLGVNVTSELHADVIILVIVSRNCAFGIFIEKYLWCGNIVEGEAATGKIEIWQAHVSLFSQ